MDDYAYVICLIYPFSDTPLFLIKQEDTYYYACDVKILKRYDKIISYDFTNAIHNMREKNIPLPEVIDVCTAKKLVTGKPKSAFTKGSEPWALKNLLGKRINNESMQWINRFLQITDNSCPSKEVLTDIMDGFEGLWNELHEELSFKNEDQRFYTIENPIYNLFLRTQFIGVNVSQEKLQDKLHELKTIQYKNYKTLEFKYGFLSQRITPKLEWDDISSHCNLEIIKDGQEQSNFWESIELYSEYDDFLDTLSNARKAVIDFNALIKYSIDDYNKIYPEFDVLGTVTGRILVSSPGIQFLKKTSRDIFQAPEDCKHIYADFDQFEPGIVASISQDRKLIDIYNKGDIYTELSDMLFGSKERAYRKTVKIIFLSFLYGMNKERLKKIITQLSGEDVADKGMAFFDEFKVLCQWKKTVCDKALKVGYSETVFGNRRYLESRKMLTYKEQRWIPNQIIQGTASYIFKKSLLEFNKHAPHINIAIPMHDAILLEVPFYEEESIKKMVEEIFCTQFRTICPDINANISFEEFSA